MTLAKNTDTPKAKRAPAAAKKDTAVTTNAPAAPPAAAVTPDNVALYLVSARSGLAARAALMRIIGHPVAASGSTLPAVLAVLNAGITADNAAVAAAAASAAAAAVITGDHADATEAVLAPLPLLSASGESRHYCDAYGYAHSVGLAGQDEALQAAHRISTGVVPKKIAAAAVAGFVTVVDAPRADTLAAFIALCVSTRKAAEDAKKNKPKAPVIGSQGAEEPTEESSAVAAAAVAALGFREILALADSAILAASPAESVKMIAALAKLAARHSTPIAPATKERLAAVTPEMIAASAARLAARKAESDALAAINAAAHTEGETRRRAALAAAGK